MKVLGFAILAVLTAAISSLPASAQAPRAKAVYVTDMSRCQPEAALARQATKDRWQLISYETVEPDLQRGTMLGAASFVDAPEVTLPLGVTGWHAVYVGFWNPHHAYDGGTTVKVKLNDDPCFTRISESEPGLVEYNATYLKEAFFKTADLTGRTLQFGKLHGPFAQKVYIAYVKLVPLSAQQAADVQADRARKETRLLQATMDGLSYFWANEYQTREHILELIEPYRDSDVGKVLWAVNYGDQTNYPTKVGRFWAERAVPIPSATTSHVTGEKAASDGLTSLAQQGIIPVAVAAQHVHAMGLKFDIMVRLAMVGAIPPTRDGQGFVQKHPQFRQVLRDGTPVQKASYAFPEVREQMVAIIRESAETFDIDGVNLCFTRGPSFTSYEQPVLDDFRKEYGEDGRKVDLDDARMRAIHGRYLNSFVGDVRKTLDEVGKKKGKRLELSTWTWTDVNRNLNAGMDVEHWIEQGWLDSALCLSESGIPIDPELIAAAKAHKCPYLLAGPSGDNSKHWVHGYHLGVDGFAVWDMDGLCDSPTLWPVLRKSGHREEIEAAAQTGPAPLRTIRLKTVGGFDVLQGGLSATAYSGG